MAEEDLTQFDFAVIGAGIAGASVCAELSRAGRVLLLEMELQPGYHTTGRSAAVFAEAYGPAPIRALTRASAAFFEAPPEGFCEHPLLSDRGIMMIANSGQVPALDAMIEELSAEQPVQRLDPEQARALNPLLRADYVAAAMHDPRGRDIDVHALHHGYLRQARRAGARFVPNAQVIRLERDAGHWHIDSRGGAFRARVVVDAAGAWADEVGQLAGAMPIGLVPKRRTAAIVAAPQGCGVDGIPITVDCQERFYLKPDAGRLLISPADETPSPPCDAQPEELDIALCVDRIETAFALRIGRIESRWAGLRSFVRDKCPVCGFDPRVPDFFWLAGQGGYGIQSAPALARLAAALALGRAVPADIAAQGLALESVAPQRLEAHGEMQA